MNQDEAQMKGNVATDKLVDMVNGRLSPEQSLEVLQQIENDPEASARLDIVADLSAMAAEEPEAFRELTVRSGRIPWTDRLALIAWRISVGRRTLLKVGVAGAALAALSLLVILFRSPGNPYAELVDLHGIHNTLQLRGSVDEDVRQAQELAAAGNHGQAIAMLERRLRIYPQDDLRDYLHYSIGLFYLASADQSRLMVRSFELEEVRSAVEHLQNVLLTTSSARLHEDAQWFLAQAYLALDEPEAARAQLLRLVDQRSFHAADASRQLATVNRLLAGH